jgi:hypothetical protein
MHYEYMFFDEVIAQDFADACREQGISAEVVVSEQINVCIPEAEADENLQILEALYDQYFFGEQASQVEIEHDDFSASGIQVQLASGQYTTIMIAPEIMNKLLSVFSLEELNQFMHQVAAAIENPNGGGSICEVMRRHQSD